jgi:hypothetical protein
MIKKLIGLLLFPVLLSASDLDRIIPPEIKDDSFYSAIYRLVQKEPIKTVLEIGSSSGEGSTEAFVRGIAENPNRPTLFCMELSKPRFLALQERYKDRSFVCCYNVSSVPLESFPSKEEVLLFMNTVETSLRGFTDEEVTGWLAQDIEYVKNANVSQRGIELIKFENNIDHFDVVLIDGSEFTGQSEFELIYGAKFILLDDIRAFKNYHNYKRLLLDPLYELVEMDLTLRNGYAVFRKL